MIHAVSFSTRARASWASSLRLRAVEQDFQLIEDEQQATDRQSAAADLLLLGDCGALEPPFYRLRRGVRRLARQGREGFRRSVAGRSASSGRPSAAYRRCAKARIGSAAGSSRICRQKSMPEMWEPANCGMRPARTNEDLPEPAGADNKEHRRAHGPRQPLIPRWRWRSPAPRPKNTAL